MEKIKKITINSIIAFCFIVIGTMLINTTTQALALPDINKSFVDIKIGQSTKLKVKNKGKYKFKWSSSNKNIATVNKNGVVKGKKAGTCRIYAKCSKPKMKLFCSVTVSHNLEKLKANIDVTPKDGDGSNMLFILRNNNNCNVFGSIQVTYFDENNFLIAEDSEYIHIASGGEICRAVDYPHDSNYKTIHPYHASYKVKVISVESKNYAEDIIATYNYSDAGIAVSFTNFSSRPISTINFTCVSYDENDKVIGVRSGYANDCSPHSYAYKLLSYPMDNDYNRVIPVRSDIYVSSAE